MGSQAHRRPALNLSVLPFHSRGSQIPCSRSKLSRLPQCGQKGPGELPGCWDLSLWQDRLHAALLFRGLVRKQDCKCCWLLHGTVHTSCGSH